MIGTTHQAENQKEIEYSIYTFDLPAAPGREKWEKRDSGTVMADALATAEEIFRTGRYGKVEVKQKYFDRKKNRNVNVTLKVYKIKSREEIDIVAMFFSALICGAMAFIITYFMNR